MARAYRTHRRSGYGYKCPANLIEVPGTGMKVFRSFQKLRLFWHGRTELTEVQGRYKNALPVPRVMWQSYRFSKSSGYGVNVVQNSQKLFVRVCMLYRTHRSCTGNTRINTRPRGRSSILSGGFHPACMACSHWANVPEAIRSCCGHYRQPPLSPRGGRLPLPALFQLSSGPLIFVLFTPRLCGIARLSHS